ncbi:MAG: hypothetical protein AB1599_07130 [Planctomycetota bacterium]
MRREREWAYSAYRPGIPAFGRARRISPASHNKSESIPTSRRGIPPLSELKRIKEARIRRIREMVRNGTYDTIERQIETARRIANILLAEKGINN